MRHLYRLQPFREDVQAETELLLRLGLTLAFRPCPSSSALWQLGKVDRPPDTSAATFSARPPVIGNQCYVRFTRSYSALIR